MRKVYTSVFRIAVLLALCLPGAAGRAETRTLNVTDFGARGDAVSITANTVDGSPVVTVPAGNALSISDIGKLTLLFGAGPATTPANHQDLIATIERVDNGTNITLSAAAGATANYVDCTYGTQNAEAFQRCVDAVTGTNTIINIPAGNYLLVPPMQATGFIMKNGYAPVVSAVVIRKGGIQFQGAGMARTVLTGCGAWKLQGKYAQRGQLFVCQGPVTNNYPLVFEDLTMDGGVPAGNTTNHWFPASVRDGSGWDVTHDAVVDAGRGPLHRVKEFRNCRFTRWRGEMLKSVSSWTNGFIRVTHCLFDDGNASGFNFSFSHDIDGCVFSNMDFAMEFYEGYAATDCFFRNCTLTGLVGNELAINGALTNRVQPNYYLTNNTFYLSHSFGILTTPAQNLFITGNRFIGQGGGEAIGLGSAGYQGTAINSNIVVAGNEFSNVYYAVSILGSGRNRSADVLVCSNTAAGIHEFANGYGWGTNVCLRNNVASAGLSGAQLKGQWFLDDLSNQFPPHKTFGGSGTNIISYVSGARQQIVASKTNCVFALDDSQPEKIPSGAVLRIAFTGKNPAPLYFSTDRDDASTTMLQNGATVTCAWTNGGWREQTPKN